MRIAFHAPMKPPDHPVPSGDRLMARLLMQAMRLAGHTVFLASRFRGFAKTPEDFQARQAEGEAEAARIAAEWQAGPMPDLFFCYHTYFKAPDYLGPPLAETFGIPYVTAEASYTLSRDAGSWAGAQAVVRRGLQQAALNLCFTGRDREGLLSVVGAERLAMLPPFIDTSLFTSSAVGSIPPRLVTVAMMRVGDKLDSYRLLASALVSCTDLPWRLAIVGDGPCRDEVREMFSAIDPARLEWLGEKQPEEVPAILAASDIYVWPGFGEAFGLAYLEAQAAGLPVVAMATAGVPEVVRDGETGLLTPHGDVAALAAAIRTLLHDAVRRQSLGAAARRFVLGERSLEKAAATLKILLARFEP
ncbi:glycosyltransferase family 4 protein [Mesorhizobium sp. LHD-90]|uniref:glycosyltransferase family 4 protein n=1 Tax=Mesorhizobium sp. LHD-90 TaxID=3071414 RepID=UPI0027DEEFB6|nr:glycosyltransferase family 4 protein [Mesorhizobium sp. LHD-90]MDQ6434732.1 glycosyltransferase family 4 protein [Mesorhizobium sp. LHD-90]